MRVFTFALLVTAAGACNKGGNLCERGGDPKTFIAHDLQWPGKVTCSATRDKVEQQTKGDVVNRQIDDISDQLSAKGFTEADNAICNTGYFTARALSLPTGVMFCIEGRFGDGVTSLVVRNAVAP
jgi:hypothetical protein